MKLPAAHASSTEFVNASGSSVPKEFAMEARKNPDVIKEMAETPKEKRELEKESLARQYVLICDKSGSMASRDGDSTRWESARLAVEKLVEKMFIYDTDGKVPLYLFDNNVEFVGECTSAGQVAKVFNDYQPGGTTDLGKCLEIAMSTYVGKKRQNWSIVPGTTFVVILDGDADDRQTVKDVIIKYSDPANNFIEHHSNIALTFIQIGDDKGATAFLKELDDKMMGTPDVCDTAKDNELFEEGGVDKILFNAIFD